MQTSQPLTKLQLELLKLYAHSVADSDLIEIKKMLANYFANKSIEEADRIFDNKEMNNNTMEQWLHE